ncbi:FkbM family methyltransferase [Stieleria varia]|uniref:2-O-methyltransferase NoeI n=1 Tax=Stieleria varia TaxID=2528005 RepID=A0A5C5ZYW5_9BACT|nr:FkbM family methyltransferase [Stieleria varia]TWT92804.1 2-O-methyltransferase NoeI [Stieleria varia]
MPTFLNVETLAAVSRQLNRLPYAGGFRPWVTHLQRRDIERCRAASQQPVEIILPGGGQRMIVDRSERIGNLFFWIGRHHRQQVQLAKKLLPTDGVFLDVGANVGEFTVAMAIDKPQAKILAIEPNPIVRTNLEANITANHLTNVSVLPIALGDQEGTETLYQCNDSLLTSFVPISSDHAATAEAEVCMLDNLVRSMSLDRLDVVKIDVEGFELKVLSGAKQSLARFRPSIIIEINTITSTAAGFDVSDVYELLRSQGYRFFAWRNRRWQNVENNLPTQEDVWAEPDERVSKTRSP